MMTATPSRSQPMARSAVGLIGAWVPRWICIVNGQRRVGRGRRAQVGSRLGARELLARPNPPRCALRQVKDGQTDIQVFSFARDDVRAGARRSPSRKGSHAGDGSWFGWEIPGLQI